MAYSNKYDDSEDVVCYSMMNKVVNLVMKLYFPSMLFLSADMKLLKLAALRVSFK